MPVFELLGDEQFKAIMWWYYPGYWLRLWFLEEFWKEYCLYHYCYGKEGWLYRYYLRQVLAVSCIWPWLKTSKPTIVHQSREGRLPQKVVFHWRLSSTTGHLLQKVFFHQRSSSTEGHLSPTITTWLILHMWEQWTYQISASYLA